jgi:hypothetical protein
LINFWNSFGFFLFGLLIGVILIELRYRYLSLVALRLSGKEEEKSEPLMGREVREIICIITVVTAAILGIIYTCYTMSTLDADWYQKNGYVRVETQVAEGRNQTKWEYRGSGKPPLPEEKK